MFSFSLTRFLTKVEEPILSYYLPIAGGRIIGFPSVLVQREKQFAWSRIWTRFPVSISYDDNHYTTGTSFNYSYPIVKIFKEIFLTHWVTFTLVQIHNNKRSKTRCNINYVDSFFIVLFS